MKSSAAILRITALGAILAVPAGLAAADVSQGSYSGKTAAEIRQQLEAQGYQVRKIDADDGYLEAHAVLNDRRYEIKVDPQTGKVIRIELDD